MDWTAVIERNREALKRIVASLVAMAGLTIGQSPRLRGRCPAGQRGVHPEDRVSAASPTLPRHLHRAVLRLLRPAEAAVRRLVIVAARDLPVEPPKARLRKPDPDPQAAHAVLRGLGLAVVMSPADLARAAAARSAASRRAATIRPRSLSLPLFDPIRTPRAGRPRAVPPHRAPRILSFDGAAPHRLPPAPSPDDPIDATRLSQRLAALASALDDLPGQARRFARWRFRNAAGMQDKALQKAGRPRRLSPLRPGRPPGQRRRRSREPAHEIHEVLGDLQHFAFRALQQPDTS